MKFAFLIFKYFPHGGLQLDFRRIARECLRRGHQITVYTRSWEGERLPEVPINRIPVGAFSNHGKGMIFEREVQRLLKNESFDAVVAFNRMAGADVYFAADNCFAAENGAKAGWKRWITRRYDIYERQEAAVFDPAAPTLIMYLTERQKRDFIRIYHTPEERFRLLPPGIELDRQRPDDPAVVAEVRQAVRREFAVDDDQLLLLQVCSGFATKGVDRTLHALVSLPDELRERCRLVIAGRESSSRFSNLARELGIDQQVLFVGGRNDVGRLLLGADLMVHPAVKEATGTVLVEALAAGLPVICTANCGYANYVADGGSRVLSSPFDQDELNSMLAEILGSETLGTMQQAAIAYARQADFYRRAAVAADIIEEAGRWAR